MYICHVHEPVFAVMFEPLDVNVLPPVKLPIPVLPGENGSPPVPGATFAPEPADVNVLPPVIVRGLTLPATNGFPLLE